jgi:uncharacterized protein YjiS (DUF1127 family)
MAAPAFDHAPLNLSAVSLPVEGVLRLAQTVALWDRRARTRRALRSLDAAALRDIGVDPQAALTESRKPFWQD